MSTSQFISVMGIFIGAGTALLVAYWHRKQMRQNEIFRIDRSAGVLPPPNPLWKFIKKYWLLLLAGLQALVLANEVLATGPVTRVSVFFIAVDVGVIVLSIMLHFFTVAFYVIGKMLDDQGRLIRVTETLAAMAKRSPPGTS
jgi:hypothetical protein